MSLRQVPVDVVLGSVIYPMKIFAQADGDAIAGTDFFFRIRVPLVVAVRTTCGGCCGLN